MRVQILVTITTVATATELYDFLRVLWARAGRTYCPNCKTQVERDTVDQVAAKLSQLPIASRWYALFPLPPEKKKDLSEELRDRPIEVIIWPLATDSATLSEPDLPPRQAGALKGRIKIAPDFNAPLDDFAEYES